MKIAIAFLLLAAACCRGQGTLDSLPIVQTLFSQVTDNTVTNTLGETSLFGNGAGRRTLGGDFWQSGRSIEARFRGLIWTPGVAAQTRFNLKLGNTVIATQLTALPQNLAGELLEIDLLLVCRTNAAAGTVIGQGVLRTVNASGTPVTALIRGSAQIDTLAANGLDITVTNSTTTISLQTRSAVVLVQ